MPIERFVILVALGIAALAFLTPAAARAAGQAPADANSNIQFRGSLNNCRVQFEQARKGHVAFMGGSITEMEGYRPLVCEMLRKRLPNTQFTFTNAGISSTCSTTGAFRLASDVLAKGPVDLLLVEFAVNDDQDAGHARRECILGMEGIVRHARLAKADMDIVIVYFVNPEMLKALQEGKTPIPIAAHEDVARHYGVSTIHLAREVAQRIQAGRLTWEKFGGTHPGPAGNALAAEMVDSLLGLAWKDPLPTDAKKAPHPLPERPLDELSYFRGRFLDPNTAKAGDGWQLGVPQWKSLKGSCRGRFANVPLLCAERSGAELTLAFDGTAIGAYVLAGPDAGIVEASVDGGPFKPVDLYHRFSRGLHYPRTVMFDANLKGGKHTLTLRTTDRKNPASIGTAMRILQFAAN